MQIGIVGLPSSGKTTLFQTMTRTLLDEGAAQKKQTNIAVVKVPDRRVDRLAEIFRPKRSVFTSVEFVDVIGLAKGDRNSTQFTSAFLANVKTNDALIHVVRAFDDLTCPHPEGSVDPARDVRLLETEFLLSDMAVVENRFERLRKQATKISAEGKAELTALETCYAALEQERPLRTLELDPAEARIVRGFQFLTAKPTLVVLNVGEEGMAEREQLAAALRAKFPNEGLAFDSFVGQVEMELAQLSDEDADAFMADYGLTESALHRIIGSAYEMLGLISFLTCGEDECRAWAIRRGASAQEAAGAIHTDLMTRFIRAETVHFDDFVELGSMTACKEKGVWRLQGKEYVVQDGDILNIRHG